VLERILPVFRGVAAIGGAPLRAAWNKLVKLPAAFHVARMTEIHPDLIRRRDFEPYLAHLAAMDPRLFFSMLDATRQHSARPWLAELPIPVLVVAGEQDRFTPPRLSKEMADLLPRGELLMVEEGTHTAPIEHPTQVDLAVCDFFDRHFGE
jgi:pimeloyl-ACP methyl ester carboxylesterase